MSLFRGILLVAALGLISSCGGGLGEGDTQIVLPFESRPPSQARQNIPYEYKPEILQGGGFKFSLINGPGWMRIDETTGTLSGVPDLIRVFEGITVTVENDNGSGTFEFDLDVIGDPLAKYAWHLNNTGQTNFSSTAGLAGEDINVFDVHSMGITGAGVLVAISDTGMEASHQDLKDNVVIELSKNYLTSPSAPLGQDPTNTYSSKPDHGTAVAGIIAAKGWNNLGTRGVAPDAGVAAFNFISSASSDPAVLIDQASGDAYDVFNQSWGSGGLDATELIPIQDYYLEQLIHSISKHRNGKGSVYVRSAGNNYSLSLPAGNYGHNTTPYVVVTGALDALGAKASYSSVGSVLWVSAPGGQSNETKPGIMTTDQSGCLLGYSIFQISSASEFEKGISPNGECNYTSNFSGTSAAAPVVSGVVALMFEARPELTWRQVKYILAATATQVDAGFAPEMRTLGSKSFTYEQGWVENAAGFKYHNFYGFGRVDALAAVKMAQQSPPELGALVQTTKKSSIEAEQCNLDFCPHDVWDYDSGPLSISIPEFSYPGVESSINVGADLEIESIQIRLSATHTHVFGAGELGIELTSPSGTKSILLNTQNGILQSGISDTVFLSNAFLGEKSKGQWKLHVFDGVTGSTGTLTNWKINVIGHAP